MKPQWQEQEEWQWYYCGKNKWTQGWHCVANTKPTKKVKNAINMVMAWRSGASSWWWRMCQMVTVVEPGWCESEVVSRGGEAVSTVALTCSSFPHPGYLAVVPVPFTACRTSIVLCIPCIYHFNQSRREFPTSESKEPNVALLCIPENAACICGLQNFRGAYTVAVVCGPNYKVAKCAHVYAMQSVHDLSGSVYPLIIVSNTSTPVCTLICASPMWVLSI